MNLRNLSERAKLYGGLFLFIMATWLFFTGVEFVWRILFD